MKKSGWYEQLQSVVHVERLLYSKTGVYRYTINLMFDPKHRLWVLIITASPILAILTCTHNIHVWKISNFFGRKLLLFTALKIAVYSALKLLYIAKACIQNVILSFTGESSAESSDSKSQSAEVSGSQHVLVCALHELGCLVLRLGTSASPLVSEPTTGIFQVFRFQIVSNFSQ